MSESKFSPRRVRVFKDGVILETTDHFYPSLVDARKLAHVQEMYELLERATTGNPPSRTEIIALLARIDDKGPDAPR